MYLFLPYLAAPSLGYGTWDQGMTWVPYMGRVELRPLDHQGGPPVAFFVIKMSRRHWRG